MFTGIVEERGAVGAMHGGRLTVRCRTVVPDSDVGASVAVNGTCLTVVERGDDYLAFDLSQETLQRTSLGRLETGSAVNLERPVSLVARLGGHLVQGHVDGMGEIVGIAHGGDGGAVLEIRLPIELARYVVEKGSLTIDGVSLTVARVADDVVSIALIPHTLAVTTFATAAIGDPVNVEVDMIARYIERLIERAE